MICRQAVVAGIFVGSICWAFAEGRDPTREPMPRSLQKISPIDWTAMIQEKEKMLRADIRMRKTAPWEGEFSRKTFAASEGWVISTSGYVSTGKLLDIGAVQSMGTRLRLVSQSPFIPDDDDQKEQELIIVTWDKRIYLIESEDAIKFCNSFNSGVLASTKCLSYLFYSKFGTRQENPSGKPHVPKKFKNYLLNNPIQAAVLKHYGKRNGVVIAGQEFPMSGIPVTINAGSNKGVLLGMQFFFQEDPERGSLYAISVSEKESELLFVGLLQKYENQVRVGLTLSTQNSSYALNRNRRQ